MDVIKTQFSYRRPLIPLNEEKVFFVILHHTGCACATPEEIHKWHLENGWYGFGYNEYIRKDGTVYIGRGDHIGAQCKNMNSKSYGIAVEGNYTQEVFMPKPQLESLVERIRYNKGRFPNCREVKPHRYFANTDCPGKYFPMERLNNELHGVDSRLLSDIWLLQRERIMLSPEYWFEHSKVGTQANGEYCGYLIKSMAKYIRNQGKL